LTKWWRAVIPVHQFKCVFLPETPPQAHPKIMFSQITGHPVAQLNGHMKLIIMYLLTEIKCYGDKFLEKELFEWIGIDQVMTWRSSLSKRI
jgi:hypothetical protein